MTTSVKISVMALAVVLALELMPKPRDADPMLRAEFRQGDGPWQDVSLPDNWRLAPGRDAVPGTYRLPLPPAADAPIAIFIPNFSGQLSVSAGGYDLSPGGILSGELVPDQSIPFFAIIPAPMSATPTRCCPTDPVMVLSLIALAEHLFFRPRPQPLE